MPITLSVVVRRARLPSVLLLAGVAPALAAAEPFVFGSFNQAALARHAPLPAPQADRRAAGLRVTLDWTNESVSEADADESLLIDGEAVRLGFELRRSHGPWQFSAELPLLATSGGTLDSLIENWHDWFGLPNGGRELRGRDKYHYQYVRDGQVLLDIDDKRSGLGDLRLGAGWCEGAGCLRTMLQLPTGDAERLTGGGLGLAAWYERGYAIGPQGRWSGSLALGASALRADGPLQDQQRQFLPFGWASVGYALTDALSAGLQFYLHSPLYRGADVDALSQAGGQLAFGLRYRASERVSWWLGMQEDPITESSPDFSIHLAADWR